LNGEDLALLCGNINRQYKILDFRLRAPTIYSEIFYVGINVREYTVS
jgi:hypothetical protein